MSEQSKIGRSQWTQVILLAVGLKAASLIVLYYGWVFMPRPVYEFDTWMVRENTSFRQNLANFDGAWFIRVAAIGYERLASGDYDLKYETERLAVMDQLGYEDGIRLFGYRHWPMMPWMIRIIAPVVGGYLNAGLLIANGFYFLFMIMLYRLCRLDFNHSTGMLAIVLVSVHPAAWTLTAALNATPFMAGAAACMVGVRQKRYLAAGLWGMMMAMTRPDGIIVLIPLLYEFLASGVPDKKIPISEVMRLSNLKKRTRDLVANPWVLALILAPLGTLLTMAFYNHIAGSAFAFTWAHDASRNGRVGFPWHVLYDTWVLGDKYRMKEIFFHILTWIVIAISVRSQRRSYLLWMISFLLFHSIHGAHGFLRYHLNLIPLFIIGASILDRHPALQAVVVALSASIFGIFSALFIRGHWVT